jgi:hypothetical protein
MRDSPCRCLLSPQQRRQKTAWWRVSTARWEPQEEGMLSTVASLPSVVKPRFNRTSRRKINFRRWCLLALCHSGQWRQKTCWCVVDIGASSPSSNVKPAHNTTKNFAPNLWWGSQSHRFAVNKGLSVSSGNRIIVCKKVNRASNSKMVKLCKGNWTGVHSSLVVSVHKINNTWWVNKLQLGNW